MTVDPNSASPESIRDASAFPPPPRVVPLPTEATAAFLARPVVFHGRSAREVLSAVAAGPYEAPDSHRRLRIERALERLGNMQKRLLAQLDAMDGDPDLEPCLGVLERVDQRRWAMTGDDDREEEPREPNLSATNAIDQRAWYMGGATELKGEHDGREPNLGGANPDVGTPTPWLTDGGLGDDREGG